jgi:hypothetical protein
MQRVIAAPEPPRHRSDLLIAIRLQHPARIAVGTDRGLKFFRRRAVVNQQEFSGLKLPHHRFVAASNRQCERFEPRHWRQ